MPDGSSNDTKSPVHHGFPSWLTQLCYFGGLIIALAAFSFNQSSDLRSVREETMRISSDVNAIRQSLPNREVYDMKMKDMEARMTKLQNDLDLKILMDQKLRESLIKRGVID